uniref:Uncharacterized protein n=1 Tax=Cotesia sesamiae Kitale bracovirus TaxID=452648 RepID=S0DH22_9VIRU|nr:conserved hypothetical protein RNAseT2-like [Cotesia sesamiae Kitale bracovirus]
MKFRKWLLVCLMFQTLLIISEAGSNSKKRNQKSSLPGLGSGTQGTSLGRTNSGRVSPTQTNVGGHHVWGTGPQVRPHQSGSRPLASSHYSRAGPSVRPQYSGALASHAPHTPTFPSPGTSQMGHPQHAANDNFPALGAPKVTYADVEKRSLNLRRSSSLSLGYHSGSRSSLSSVGSIAANPIGLGAPRSTAIMKSAAHPKKCVDNTGTTPKFIAPAEHCFDFFKLAVAWSPGFAYKQWVTGYQICADKVHPSWIIHGLWPTMFERYKNPMPRCRRNIITFNRNRFINNKMLRPLDNTWYICLSSEMM